MQNENKLIIETHNLNFGFSKRNNILSNINLQVERGSIYGFLGPNGSGKTTTIRLLLGLLPDNNSVRLFGKELSENRIAAFSKVGALIEQPSLYEHITGYDNLDITRRIKKISQGKMNEVLQTVKLSHAAHKPVKAYSLGMKQRLGLALALLGNPELLILDEPINGLDPNGIAEIRELLIHLNKEFGTTIFLSSHLLTEVEKIVSHVGIINMGRMLFQGTIGDLQKYRAKELEVSIETDNNKTAFQLLSAIYSVAEKERTLIIKIHSKKEVHQIIQLLISRNISVYEATILSKDLEQLFLTLTESYSVH